MEVLQLRPGVIMKPGHIYALAAAAAVAAVFSQPWLTNGRMGRRQAMPEAEDSFKSTREDMVSSQVEARGVLDPRVLKAMRAVPRHEFVPPGLLGEAYNDGPLPIGQGQTISQPYIVAFMTEALGLKPGDKVLEVGTGSGYQAAVLAAITPNVYSVEIVCELERAARERLNRLGYGSVKTRCADGYAGWPEEAPFDAIILTAAPEDIPRPLLEQLAEGGRLVAPVGGRGYQELVRVRRKGREFLTERLLGVAFVPMTGEAQRK